MIVLKWIIGIILCLILAAFLSVFAYFIYCQLKIAYWDRKVVELCKKDGGVVIYQTVELTEDEYKKFGGVKGMILVPDKKLSVAKRYDYLSETNTIYIHDMNPVVRRDEYIDFRKKDKKILGKAVIYSRVGGDMPTGIGHDSSFSCLQIKGFKADLERRIFSIKGRRNDHIK